VARVEATGIDRLFTGDHVTFQGGQGFDGLLNATAMAVASRRLMVQTAVYLLPLRHPVLVARQIATLAELAPGRLVFGVGLGGEDPAELRACGVDPATRGRRMDEALTVLRPLLAGTTVTMRGTFFTLDEVRIQPVPEPAVPIIVGGRSDVALRRVARHGDGWLGLWVSPQRYAHATRLISTYAGEAGRRPLDGCTRLTCGAGSGLRRTPQVAVSLRPYVAAGCLSFNLIPVTDSEQAAIDGVSAVRSLLSENRRPSALRADVVAHHRGDTIRLRPCGRRGAG
jgi:alkanesulfonate monooxygenase SsuD/methylene tetrahydromethanopterin reductase-like flavin-dependent oxidoreductase (luciferase family)